VMVPARGRAGTKAQMLEPERRRLRDEIEQLSGV
jgi:hypothetical protein